MKPYIYLFLIMIFISGQARAQETRDLGSVDLSKNKDYYLSAFEKGGKFIYKIYNQNDPATEVTSFSLINNNFDNFKEMMNSATQEHDSLENIDLEELEKYYFYFTTQNVFLIENEPGKKAMEMVFNESAPVYAYHHSNFAAIKEEDIYYMLKKLFAENENVEIKESFVDNPFNYDYTSLTLKDTPIIFDNSFTIKKEEISKIKNDNERLETLYKAINKQYYEAIQKRIAKKVEDYEKTNNDSITKLKKAKDHYKKNTQALIADTTQARLHIRINQQNIQASEKSIANNKEKLQEPIILYKLKVDEEETEDLQTGQPDIQENVGIDERSNKLDSSISEIEKLYTKILDNKLVKVENEPKNLFTPANSSIDERLKKADILRSNLQGIAIRITEIETEQSKIKINQDSIDNFNSTIRIKRENLFQESRKIDSLNKLIDQKETERSKEVSDQLKQLLRTHKFEFKPSSVQLEINRGFIENITVNGSASIYEHRSILEKDTSIIIPEHHLKFINDYPLGISSKKDIEKLGNFKLYSRFRNGSHFELKMGDFIQVIIEKLELNRKDYSPKDGSYEITLPSENKTTFHKADSKEILQVKIYSDFVGIQDNNPNGLIQLEFDKEIPLITRRFPKPYVIIPVRYFILSQGNVGVFNYFRPQFIYSKIENNNKYLEVKGFTSGSDSNSSIEYGVSTLDLKQYEVFSIGADLNLFLYDIPNTKSTFLINSGFRFGRTNLAVDQDDPDASGFPRKYTNTLQPSLEGLLRINGDERFGFEFSYGINWLLSDELFFTQKANVNGFTDFETFSKSNENNTLQRATILAYLNINKENQGRLFFRYRYNAELGNFKNNFAQLQIGYTTYLTRQNK